MQNRMVRPDENFGKDHGLIHEVVVTGRKIGAGQEFWAKLAHDEDLFRKVVTLVDRNGIEATTSQKLARAIGIPVFGVEEAIRHLVLNPSRHQLAALSEVPFTEATLEECKDSHVLVAVFPLSIIEIHGKIPSGQRLFYNRDWYNEESFAKDRGETEWQLVRKTPVPNSTGKTWQEQWSLLAKDEETPKARVIVYTIIGHYLATSERLFDRIYVRCSDVVSDGYRVSIGRFGSRGLGVGRSWDVDRHDHLGLASVRKSN